ncbi:MAG: phosphatase PAP2 family protein [Sphingobacteriaceae bacterium]|nr:phosphatase PAP2 family protein [Sphingobacteriaceae bacterium]
MEQLVAIDKELFFWVNRGLAHPLLDVFLPLARNMFFWAPLYLFLIVFFPLNFGKQGWLIVLGVVLTFACTDFISSSIIKPWVGRLRPCNDEEVRQWVRLLVSCGGGKSFTSSHAANHFGVGVFVGLALKPYFRWALPLFVLWAGTISLAQVYVGVHYPLDIVAGALLGSTMAVGMWQFYRKKWEVHS